MALVQPENWRPQGVADLEQRAWDALRQVDRSVLVTAGAGAGKTEFLAQKATYLLQTGLCPGPKRILAISFKRDAARNLAERVKKRCPPEQARRFNSFTFDAFAKSLLDRFRAAVPESLCPPASYRIIFPQRRDYEDFLDRRGFRGVTWDRSRRQSRERPFTSSRMTGQLSFVPWRNTGERNTTIMTMYCFRFP